MWKRKRSRRMGRRLCCVKNGEYGQESEGEWRGRLQDERKRKKATSKTRMTKWRMRKSRK